ncbi:hypothetical protein [Mycobacterium phage WXIN]|nr:hypothetical protein [Mycobacterium phage WXIN]
MSRYSIPLQPAPTMAELLFELSDQLALATWLLAELSWKCERHVHSIGSVYRNGRDEELVTGPQRDR